MCKNCIYTLFGKPRETCIKCGNENPLITQWRKTIVALMEKGIDSKTFPLHPYLVEYKGIRALQTVREYKKAMRSKSF